MNGIFKAFNMIDLIPWNILCEIIINLVHYRNYKAEIYAFGKRLGEDFKEDLLREAFTEKSFIIKESEKLMKVGVDPQLDMKDNSNFAVEGEKFTSQYVHKYLVTVLPSLPSEHIK